MVVEAAVLDRQHGVDKGLRQFFGRRVGAIDLAEIGDDGAAGVGDGDAGPARFGGDAVDVGQADGKNSDGAGEKHGRPDAGNGGEIDGPPRGAAPERARGAPPTRGAPPARGALPSTAARRRLARCGLSGLRGGARGGRRLARGGLSGLRGGARGGRRLARGGLSVPFPALFFRPLPGGFFGANAFRRRSGRGDGEHMLADAGAPSSRRRRPCSWRLRRGRRSSRTQIGSPGTDIGEGSGAADADAADLKARIDGGGQRRRMPVIALPKRSR